MKTVFIAKREHDREGFMIIGVFSNINDASVAVDTDKSNGYISDWSIDEVTIGKYYDIDEYPKTYPPIATSSVTIIT